MAGAITAPKVYNSSEELDRIRRARGTLNPETGRYENRDEAAFTELYGLAFARVRALCYRMLRPDIDGANETINRTFVCVWSKLHQFQEDSAFTTWVTRIAINEVLMYARKSKKHKLVISYDAELGEDGAWRGLQIPDPMSEMDALIDRERISKAMLRVPVKYRPILMLRFVDGLSNEEIFADKARRAELGIKSLASLKSTIYRGRRIFLSALEAVSACPKPVAKTSTVLV